MDTYEIRSIMNGDAIRYSRKLGDHLIDLANRKREINEIIEKSLNSEEIDLLKTELILLTELQESIYKIQNLF